MMNKKILMCLGVCAAVVGGMLAPDSALAARLGVRVLDANTGLPVPNASVCVGTASDPTLYGTGVTAFNGVALYDNVPDRSLLITVSKRNFRGIALQKPPSGDNVILDVTVTEGLSSKKCRALKMVEFKPGISNDAYEPEWPLAINNLSFFPAGNDGFSFLTHSIGKPTHYRVSTRKDFNGAQWFPYSDVLHFSPERKDFGKSVLYFQLKKQMKVEGGEIEALSEVTSQPVYIAKKRS